jgi:hypothetical protein
MGLTLFLPSNKSEKTGPDPKLSEKPDPNPE